MLIFIVLGYLGCGSGLAENYRAIILYWGADFGIRCSISLYCLLMIFIQVLKVFSRSISIREVFSLGFKDLIRLLINTELF